MSSTSASQTDPHQLIKLLSKLETFESLSQQEREAVQEIERLREQAEDPRKVMKVKNLMI